jgi:hypothetical protein
MRTTIELPDDLLTHAKRRAALEGISLKEFFIEAIEQKLAPPKIRVRRPPPAIGDARGPRLAALTREQIDEAMFG